MHKKVKEVRGHLQTRASSVHLMNPLLSIILISEDIFQLNFGQFHSQQASRMIMSEFLLNGSALTRGKTLWRKSSQDGKPADAELPH